MIHMFIYLGPNSDNICKIGNVESDSFSVIILKFLDSLSLILAFIAFINYIATNSI